MLLAIDTATAACSAALIEGGDVVHAMRELVGRGHAERIVPMVEALLAEAGFHTFTYQDTAADRGVMTALKD